MEQSLNNPDDTKTKRHKKSNELTQRVITGGIIGIIGVLVLCFSEIQWLFRTVIALLAIGAGYELTSIRDLKGNRVVLLLLSLLAIGSSTIHIPLYYPMILPVFVAVLCAFATLIVLTERQWQAEINLPLLTVLAIICILFFHAAIEIRYQEHGFLYLLITVICTSATDVFAYFIGRSFGTHKLMPKTSPSKTVEGAVGGTTAAVFAALLAGAVVQKIGATQVRAGELLMYALSISIIGQFGDLALSTVKRMAKVKDYGSLMPGHGGILDRFDSLLFALPLAYVLYNLDLKCFV